MRVLTCLTAALLGTAVMFAQPLAASAQGTVEGSVAADQSWQTCISATTPPDDKVAACSAIIDAKRETGSKLAAAYCFRGHGLTEKRQLDAALSDLNESIRLEPTSACALTNRGRVYAFKRDLDRAIADYDEAIRIDPAFALAYNNRGDAWFNKGDLDRAIADFSASIKHNPSLATAYGNRGYAYHRKRDMARAVADYTMEIKLGRTCWPTSTAATPIATANRSTAPQPTMARSSSWRRRTRAAGAIAA
jgi:tetratricopeptide (TPR) repeat protein